MNNATMMYRCPGAECIWGVSVDTLVVDEADVEAKKAEGWHLTVPEADEAAKAAVGKVAANEAEQAVIEAKLTGAAPAPAKKRKGQA